MATVLEAVKAETPTRPPEERAFAAVGVAVKTVRAELPVANEEAADKVAEVTFVMLEIVNVEAALAPNIEIDILVVDAAHDSKWPIA
jgi:hypothetical protein